MEKLNFDLAEKEPQLEKMDASISKLDGAMSPVFILKQILIEQSNLMNSVKNFKFNFDSKTSEDLNPIIVDLEKFEEKLSRLNEILEKQEDYQGGQGTKLIGDLTRPMNWLKTPRDMS